VAQQTEDHREFQNQRQREAWSRQGLDEQSQQQLRSNSDLALRLIYVRVWTCCLYSFVKHISDQRGFCDGSVVQQRPLFRR